MDANAIFLDTNVLVYAVATSSPLHRLARQSIADQERAGRRLWVSHQVLREYLAVLSRPQTYSQPLHPQVLTADVRLFESYFSVAEDGRPVTAQLLDLMMQLPIGGRQVHDANIVATMLVHGIPALLTANLADFARFAGLISVIPLAP